MADRARLRQQRLRLECTHRREAAFKARALDLLRAGASTSDPEFVHAFSTAKEAHLSAAAQLSAAIRVRGARQKIDAIRAQLAAQREIKALLLENRRYAHADFAAAFDSAEDQILELEERLDDSLLSACQAAPPADSWLGEDDSELLTSWLVQATPPPPPSGAAALSALPKTGGGGGARHTDSAREGPGSESFHDDPRPCSARPPPGARARGPAAPPPASR
ncbi:tegument protein UL14 [Beluga whale alphaherpesvirus 1]|uniref:Tegument protein UL14 n=1 Tax=Beluga whale alphaherpesvirus 1 TaxID=1434720 RepID=A0A286MM67_9ALPH|nr:tegument protein UL14 [Beluga whale alphaherpesvirus 1]ASW27093.1 tegument protein UL14 [Beluga whale alphaherpesvirus 1]